jgi:hypothetical protein
MATYYWVGSGTWNTTSTANWATTSGGSAGHGPPGSSDSVVFDNNSGNCTLGDAVSIYNIDITTGYSGYFGAGSGYNVLVYGPTCTLNNSFNCRGLLFDYNGTVTLTTGSTGITISQDITLNGSSTVLSLASDFEQSGASLSVSDSGQQLETNGHALELASLSVTAGTVTLGSSQVYLYGSGTVWDISSGCTVSAASSTINLTRAGQTFAAGGYSYGTLSIQPNGGTITIQGSNSFATLENQFPESGDTLTLQAGTTQTISSALDLNGSAGNLFTVNSDTPGTQATFSSSSATITASYLSLQDNAATGGADFVATNSIAVSNVTGWSGFGAALVAYAQIKLSSYAAQIGVAPFFAKTAAALRAKPGAGGSTALTGATLGRASVAAGSTFPLAFAGIARAVISGGLIPASGQVARIAAQAMLALRARVAPAGTLNSLTGATLAAARGRAPLFDYSALIALVGSASVALFARAGSTVSTALLAKSIGSVKSLAPGVLRVLLAARAETAGAGKAASIVRLALHGSSLAASSVSSLVPALLLAVAGNAFARVSATASKIQTLTLYAIGFLLAAAKGKPGGNVPVTGKGVLTLTAPAKPGPFVPLVGEARSAARVFVSYTAVASLASVPLIAVKAKTAATVALSLGARSLAAALVRVLPQGITAIASTAAATLRGRAGPSGTLPVTGAAKIKLAAASGPSGSVGIFANSLAALRASAANVLVPLALHASAATALKVRAGSTAAASLAGRSAASIAAVGGATFKLAFAAATRLALAANVPVRTPLSLAANALAALKVRAGSSAALSLAASALAATRAKASVAATVGIAATAVIAARVQSAPRGIVGIAGAVRAAVTAPSTAAVLHVFLSGATIIASRAKAAQTSIGNLVSTTLIGLQGTTISKAFTLGRVLQNVTGRLRSLRNLRMRD